MPEKRALSAVFFAVLFLVVLLAVPNLASLHDGLLFLRDMLSYRPDDVRHIDPNGPFGMCGALVQLRNAERAAYIRDYLTARGIPFEQIAASNSPNILVRFPPAGLYTIFSAHYDKLIDTPEYQGASDNSAAVCALLAAADTLSKRTLARPIALLWTAEEEQGLVGARAFVAHAQRIRLQVAHVVNLDSIGRGGLAARASGERSGLVFLLPAFGEWVYDGHNLRASAPYRLPDPALLARLGRLAPITVLDRMVAYSDGSRFEGAGWPTVTLTGDNIYFIEETWHSLRDRIELLDERNLELAYNLLLDYAALSPSP